ncbi:Hypothetical_protein [Hexamita inflata]|uniref:Hypothetical_protein n=1 Tax=Hexamita inflata TaxID=28002 RepID=A0AA86QVP7_9EUKA|nr:Hypothetical protein HINF_LOCUS46030 [Hexamita inflata]
MMIKYVMMARSRCVQIQRSSDGQTNTSAVLTDGFRAVQKIFYQKLTTVDQLKTWLQLSKLFNYAQIVQNRLQQWYWKGFNMWANERFKSKICVKRRRIQQFWLRQNNGQQLQTNIDLQPHHALHNICEQLIFCCTKMLCDFEPAQRQFPQMSELQLF